MSWFDDLRARFGRADDPEPLPPALPSADAPETPVAEAVPVAEAAPAETAAVPYAANARADTPRADAPRADGASSTIFYRYYTDIHGTPDHTKAYEHGHVDGTHEGDPDAFRDVIAHAERVARLTAAVEQTRAELDEALAERKDGQALRVERAGMPRQVEHLQHVRDLAARDHLEAQSHLADAVQNEIDTRDRASWANVWIYALAAIVFILGDFAVSKAIVTQVLKIEEHAYFGLDWLTERGLFAAGIAFLAFIVKVAYERMVEVPYRHNEKRPFRRAIWPAVVLTMGTLALLGYSRGWHIANTTGGPVTLDGPVAAAVAMPWYVLWSYVLIAVLFAVAGGMCSGIAVQAWHVQMDERGPARKRLKAAEARLDASRPALDAAEAELAQVQQRQLELDERYEHLAPLDGVARRVDESRSRLDALREELRASRTAWLTALYDSGFTLAEANRVYLDKTPHATLRRLAQLSADVLRAMQDGQIAEADGQSLVYALQHAAEQYLAGDLSLDSFRALLGALEQRLHELVAAGPPSAEQTWASEGDGSPRAPSSRTYAGPRPFVWARQEMSRLSRQ